MKHLNAYALRALLCLCVLQSAAAVASNVAPVITGHPPTSTTVGTYYSFHPDYSDANGNTLSFTTANCPGWAFCNPGTGSLKGTPTQAGVFKNIVITVSDGKLKTALPAFTITVTGSGSKTATNTPPTISGSPPTSATVSKAYSFQPSASDANADKLTFAIAGKPAWASFDTSRGALTGTPSTSYIGKSGSITISVSDGKASASLPAFTITVAAASSPGASGSATLNWMPPTENSNGSTLTNLAGYYIMYGTNSSSLSKTIQVANAGLTSYQIDGLTTGTWYFGVEAYTTNGTSSSLSGLVSKTIH